MDRYLTVKELMKILNLGRTKTYELVNQDDFPKVKIGGKILIPESEFQTFMKQHLYKKYEL